MLPQSLGQGLSCPCSLGAEGIPAPFLFLPCAWQREFSRHWCSASCGGGLYLGVSLLFAPPGVPEKVGLYFLCGVSGGLMLLLCIISPKTTFLQEVGEALKDPEVGSSSELSRTKLRDEQDEDLPDDSSSDSSFRRLTHTYRATDSIFGPELTAAMEGAVEHQGRGGEEIWMPKESSPYAIHKIKSATK